MGSDMNKYGFWSKPSVGAQKSEDEDEGDHSRLGLANDWVCRKIHPA
jgi:hypothetical protein